MRSLLEASPILLPNFHPPVEGVHWGAPATFQLLSPCTLHTTVSRSGPYRPPGGVEEMQGAGRRVHLEWGAYITV
ncbi:hypothetical protein FHG87_008703 [Trinorchestia longiramus]|nr:hypothetical protein FHG87_008703 [Trinorchestia longiramus]